MLVDGQECDGSGVRRRPRASSEAMGAVPGTFSRRKESQAPGPRCVASRNAGLLVRRGSCRGRPSVAPSARSRGSGLKDCDRADGTPAACIVAGRAAPGRCTAGVARLDIVRSVKRSRKGIAGTMSNPARPGERHTPACSTRDTVRCRCRCRCRCSLFADRCSVQFVPSPSAMVPSAMTISTRRFLARPVWLVLSAIGRSGP